MPRFARHAADMRSACRPPRVVYASVDVARPATRCHAAARDDEMSPTPPAAAASLLRFVTLRQRAAVYTPSASMIDACRLTRASCADGVS